MNQSDIFCENLVLLFVVTFLVINNYCCSLLSPFFSQFPMLSSIFCLAFRLDSINKTELIQYIGILVQIMTEFQHLPESNHMYKW